MARINHATGVQGQNLYVMLRNCDTHQLWNGSAWVANSAATYSAFALNMTQYVDSASQGMADYYYDVGAAEAALGSNSLRPTCIDYIIRQRAGGSPAVSDTVIAQGTTTKSQQVLRNAMALGSTVSVATGSIDQLIVDAATVVAQAKTSADAAAASASTAASSANTAATNATSAKTSADAALAAAQLLPTAQGVRDAMCLAKSGGQSIATDSVDDKLDSGAAGLTQQQVRDAMCLAKSGGQAIVADSIDDKIGDTLTSANAATTAANNANTTAGSAATAANAASTAATTAATNASAAKTSADAANTSAGLAKASADATLVAIGGLTTTGISAQQVRDAMALAPSVGVTPAAASIDQKIVDCDRAVEIAGVTTDVTLAVTQARDSVIAKVESVTIAARSAPPAGGVGTGSVGEKIHIVEDGEPVPYATVWVTSDLAGNTIIAGSVTTDAHGRTPKMYFDPEQTIYVWAMHSVIQVQNPTKLVWSS